MPRPTKCRKVCHFPKTLEFSPVDVSTASETVILAVDEYEALRLIDKEGMSQEECAAFMQIARTTVQRIYDTARKKVALCVVDGRPLRIEGGDFKLCNGMDTDCGYNCCYKQQYHEQYKTEKGEHIMRVAVTYENGQIFQHFGHTEQFKIYDVQDGEIVDSQIVETNGSGHGALAGVLTALNVDVLICGGIGGGAQMELAAANIQLYGGVSGSADEAVKALLAENLAYDPNVKCDHHGEGHSCGNHGCESHNNIK